MNYKAPDEIYYNYITIFTYEQLCSNINRIMDLLKQGGENHALIG